MTETNGARAGTRDPEQIESDIERTRAELAATIAAVAHRADVKSQARHRVDQTKARVSERRRAVAASAGESGTALAAGAVVLVGLALTIWLIRR